MRQTEVRSVNDIRAAVGEAEWASRVDLAACYRLVALYGMTDLIYNHISAQVPGHDDKYLINPYGICLLYTSPSPRDRTRSRMPSSA